MEAGGALLAEEGPGEGGVPHLTSAEVGNHGGVLEQVPDRGDVEETGEGGGHGP